MQRNIKIPYQKNYIEAHTRKKIPFLMVMFTTLFFFLCVNLVSADWESLSTDLISWWSFNTNAEDSTPNNHDGTLEGTTNPSLGIGQIGNSYWFTAAQEHRINVSNTDGVWDFGAGDFTINLWVYSNITGTQALITHGYPDNGFVIRKYDNDVKSEFNGVGPDLTSGNKLGEARWVMVTLSGNSTEFYYHLNGTYWDDNITRVTINDNAAAPLNFGWMNVDNRWLTGSVDEVGIWNRTLTDSEISDLWNSGAGIPYGGVKVLTINLISPIDNFKSETSGLNFTGNYTTNGANLTNATYYIWDSAGIIFNDTETILINGTSNSSTHEINNFTAETYTWNILVCGENATQAICGWAENNYSFEYVPFSVIEESYSNQTIEGNLETFSISIKMEGGYTLSIASLVYNNTNYLGTLDDLGGGNYEISRNLIIPSVSSDINMTFYWAFSFENEFLTNTTSHNQSVSNVIIDNCSIYTNAIYNFSIVDEESQDSISGNNSIEILVNVYSADRSVLILNYSESFNMSSMGLCINRELGNFTSTHLLDSTIKYLAQDHETEYYNIDSYSLTNQSKAQNIILYDLLTSDSTEFQLTFTGSNFLAVENALVFVKRQYVSENVFKTVELPKTDSNGQTILHLVKNDVIYNLEVMKDGIVIGSFENIIAFCEDVVIGDCKITLSAAESGEAVFKYDDALGITYTGPTYNNATRLITFNFLTTDGSVKTILMEATRNDIFGNRSVCSAFVVSSGGTLICTVPSYIDDSTIITKVFVDGIEILKDYTVLSEFSYGKDGYFIFFIYMIAFILMFSKSKTTMLIGIMVGFIVGISLGLISGRLVGVGASGIWLAIVIILMVWKLNKERPD